MRENRCARAIALPSTATNSSQRARTHWDASALRQRVGNGVFPLASLRRGPAEVREKDWAERVAVASAGLAPLRLVFVLARTGFRIAFQAIWILRGFRSMKGRQTESVAPVSCGCEPVGSFPAGVPAFVDEAFLNEMVTSSAVATKDSSPRESVLARFSILSSGPRALLDFYKPRNADGLEKPLAQARSTTIFVWQEPPVEKARTLERARTVCSVRARSVRPIAGPSLRSVMLFLVDSILPVPGFVGVRIKDKQEFRSQLYISFGVCFGAHRSGQREQLIKPSASLGCAAHVEAGQVGSVSEKVRHSPSYWRCLSTL